MSGSTVARWASTLCLAVLTAGCQPQGVRCAKCGMPVGENPRWEAGAVDVSGNEEHFCSPRCMFVWRNSPSGTGSHDLWVTEYYTQKRTAVEEVFFVPGSDVVGPMGKSLVPVAGRESAEQFRTDHRGSGVFTAGEVTPALLRELMEQPHKQTAPE